MYAPIKSGVNCKAGCVAVALGQIIASNNYYYNQYSLVDSSWRSGVWVNWDPIYDAIDAFTNNPTKKSFFFDEEFNSVKAKGIATLLHEIGIQVDMDYGPKESGASDADARRFLIKNGYENVELLSFSHDLLLSMIYNNYPVYVSGRDTDADKGHAWVIDGMLKRKRTVETVDLSSGKVLSTQTENETLYHCNFGWAGLCDGYYHDALYYNLNFGPRDKEYKEEGGSRDRFYSSGRKIITYTGWHI